MWWNKENPNVWSSKEVVVPGDTIPRLFWNAVGKRADKVIFRQKSFGLWQTLTWRELADIVRQLYRTLGGVRRAIRLLDRSAHFDPQLATLWFSEGRSTLVGGLADYLARRIKRGLFRPVPDARVAARLVMETVVTWAVHRHWDPSPEEIDDALAEDTVVQFIVGGLVKGGGR